MGRKQRLRQYGKRAVGQRVTAYTEVETHIEGCSCRSCRRRRAKGETPAPYLPPRGQER